MSLDSGSDIRGEAEQGVSYIKNGYQSLKQALGVLRLIIEEMKEL